MINFFIENPQHILNIAVVFYVLAAIHFLALKRKGFDSRYLFYTAILWTGLFFWEKSISPESNIRVDALLFYPVAGIAALGAIVFSFVKIDTSKVYGKDTQKD